MDSSVTEVAIDLPVWRELLRRIQTDAEAPMTLSSPRSFELLRPDTLPVRVTVHPCDTTLVLDLYLYNAQLVRGDLRTGLCQSLLLLNHAGLRGRPFALGLDSRDFVLLTASLPLNDALLDEFTSHLDYLSNQSLGIRELIGALTLADVEIPFEMRLGVPAEMPPHRETQ
ncbi:hypothetical protein D1006_35145 [Burkholderia stabilis]|uniref:Uncharacterized protein n=1 Tax=Burkholderia stabilis TaxID=95485 RepID=A0A4Q2A8D8_9BURK|nr:hypothetical protein [Burkholderia stabilis]RXV65335.1 hypothetical protein D1006_35145 [Burkholderia stabilis]